MKKEEPRSRARFIILTLGAITIFLFVILPIFFLLFGRSPLGNVALIPITGPISLGGEGKLGERGISSEDLVQFVKDADDNAQVKVILLDINSPGGSAVASDEVAAAVKQAKKPVVALIREVGASGAYWIASASDQIIANRMSITGSIGVLSSYLEFDKLMEKYGISYQQMTAGKYKDIGTPFRELKNDERQLLQSKLNKIHSFFIQEIADNRKLDVEKVRELATGEFFLGVEAQQLGLIDRLGDKTAAEEYLKATYALDEIRYVIYAHEPGFFDFLDGVMSDFSISLGQGIGSVFLSSDPALWT